jgi:3-hydroxybutyryl-CoA dehydratase
MTISIGDATDRVFHVSDETIEHFAAACGDRNPIHFDEAYAQTTRFGGRIAHGMLTGALISAVLGCDLPGAGTVYLGQELAFRAPVRPGDDVRVHIEVTEYEPQRRRATLQTDAYVADTLVATGQARVIAPE